MAFVEYDDVVQTIPPYAAMKPLETCVLPRALIRGDYFFDVHRIDSFAKHVSISAIAVSEQESRCGIPRERPRVSVALSIRLWDWSLR